MPTDDERGEVASKLRSFDFLSAMRIGLARGSVSAGTLRVLGAIVGVDMTSPIECAQLFERLADLIEPNRGSGGRSILCAHCEKASWCGCEPGDEEGGCDFEPSVTEGEPPYNLYSLYEAVLRRRPRDEYAIDDDEVDELVDALLELAEELSSMRPCEVFDRRGAAEISRRIREACGEAANGLPARGAARAHAPVGKAQAGGAGRAAGAGARHEKN